MTDLKVTTIQADIIWENKTSNLKKYEQLLSAIPLKSGNGNADTDIIILPEMFTTGFSMNPKPLAETLFGQTFQWMADTARRLDAVVTGSFICVDNGHYYNRLIWMQPDGNYAKYDKRHLFSLANEHLHYTEGGTRQTVTWRGWRICPLICYDLRFPVWSRNVPDFPLKDENFAHLDASPGYYDLLLYVANWPERRSHAWKSLLAARALENQTYVVGVNRVGNDGNDVYHSGDTSIIDFTGDILFYQKHTEGVHTTILSLSKLQEFRKKFGFLNDQDSFSF